MSKELTEAKDLTRQAMEKISQYELLEEARRRGFVKGAKFRDILSSSTAIFVVDELNITETGYLHCGHGVIYDPNQNKWAEIIPEQEENPLCPTCHKYENINCSNSFHLSAQSLHDQIREGGWKKVFELARFKIETRCIETYPIHPISRIDSHPMTKADTYIKLLALSKVLNEGKKQKGKYYYIINSNSIDLYIDGWNGNPFPIWFYLEEDAFFALEFAEKEWKIFYNQWT